MAEEQTHTLQPGEFGMIVRKDGKLDLLVPNGEEGKPIGQLHRALIGAVCAMGDTETRNLFEERYRTEMQRVVLH